MDKHTQNDHNNPINWKESEEDREHAKNELMRDTLQRLTIKYLGEDATDYLSLSDELGDYDSDQLWEELNDNGFFNVEIIYYSKAMDYLRDNDISLNESLELAEEMGFNLQYINSECLASLHASHQRENKFWEDVVPELEKLFNN
jgi:hypothetical protein